MIYQDLIFIEAMLLAVALFIAYGASWGLTSWAARAGTRWGVVGEVTDRSSHARPTSRLGGVGLIGGFLIGAFFFVGAVWLLPRVQRGWGGNLELMGWLMLGAIGLFIVGLIDDFKALPPLAKLLLQIVAILPITRAPLRFMSLDIVAIPGLSPTAVSTLFAVAWVVFFVNAFNFMDGMDGSAARFAMNVCKWLFIMVLAKVGVEAAMAYTPSGGSVREIISREILRLRLELFILPILGGACAGFYQVNHPPARVFMGDAGSLALGYLLAIQVLLADGGFYMASMVMPDEGRGVPAGAVWLLLLPFVFDVVLTLLRRAQRGEPLLAAHRSHLYQRLMIVGMSHREVLGLNANYVRACTVLALIYGLTPVLLVRTLIWFLAAGVMMHYWRLVLRKERETESAG